MYRSLGPAFARSRGGSELDVARFLEGAGSAYRLILESFWKADLGTLKPHVDAHLYEHSPGRSSSAARTASSSTTGS